MRHHGYGTQILVTLGLGVGDNGMGAVSALPPPPPLSLSGALATQLIDGCDGPLSLSTLFPCLMDDADKFGVAPFYLYRSRRQKGRRDRPKCVRTKNPVQSDSVAFSDQTQWDERTRTGGLSPIRSLSLPLSFSVLSRPLCGST